MVAHGRPHFKDVFRVAFGAVMVGFSNYSYEPSLGRRVSAGKEEILDADVAGVMTARLRQMVADIAQLQLQLTSLDTAPSAKVIGKSFFDHSGDVEAESVDFLITSPPYLNNYHYIRNTRPHLFWLGLVEHTKGLKGMEQANFGKYWQTVREQRLHCCVRMFSASGRSWPLVCGTGCVCTSGHLDVAVLVPVAFVAVVVVAVLPVVVVVAAIVVASIGRLCKLVVDVDGV